MPNVIRRPHQKLNIELICLPLLCTVFSGHYGFTVQLLTITVSIIYFVSSFAIFLKPAPFL